MNAKRAKRLRRAAGFSPEASRTYSPQRTRGLFGPPTTVRLDKSDPRVLYQAYKRAMKAARAKGMEA